MLSNKEIGALENIFNIELLPEEYEWPEDDFILNYGQMDLDLFEEEAERKPSKPPRSESN